MGFLRIVHTPFSLYFLWDSWENPCHRELPVYSEPRTSPPLWEAELHPPLSLVPQSKWAKCTGSWKVLNLIRYFLFCPFSLWCFFNEKSKMFCKFRDFLGFVHFLQFLVQFWTDVDQCFGFSGKAGRHTSRNTFRVLPEEHLEHQKNKNDAENEHF